MLQTLQKNSTFNFLCSLDTFLFWIDYSDKNHLIIIRRCSCFIKPSKNLVVSLIQWLEFELKVKTSCYGHYTTLVYGYYNACGTFFYTVKNKGVFLFISKLLIIDLVRTDKFLLIRPNYKLILFSGCADIHNINTTLGCKCNFGMWSIPLRACSLQFSFIEHVL